MSLRVEPESRFTCSLCADCCTRPWSVLVTADEKAAIEGQPWPEAPPSLFDKASGGLWALKKKPGTTECGMLGEDKLCRLHALFGEASKPTMCRRFPFLHTASDEAVWVTASYGCRAVSEGRGAPLEDHRRDLERIYAQDVGETDPDSGTVYPLRPGLDLSTPELDAALDALDWGADVFEAMEALTRFAWAVEREPGDAEGSLRYALALTLYSDLVGEGFWGRLRGVFTLPQALTFTLVYESRLLGRRVDLAALRRAPAELPEASHALLTRWLRSRVRSRRVFRNAPHAAAGITRLLIQANLVLLFARALAMDPEGDAAPIREEHALGALRTVEQYVANQEVLSTLTRLDPRLKAAWENPQVAWAAVDFLRRPFQG